MSDTAEQLTLSLFMFMYGCFTLLYRRKEHNIVKQYTPININLKINLKRNSQIVGGRGEKIGELAQVHIAG